MPQRLEVDPVRRGAVEPGVAQLWVHSLTLHRYSGCLEATARRRARHQKGSEGVPLGPPQQELRKSNGWSDECRVVDDAESEPVG